MDTTLYSKSFGHPMTCPNHGFMSLEILLLFVILIYFDLQKSLFFRLGYLAFFSLELMEKLISFLFFPIPIFLLQYFFRLHQRFIQDLTRQTYLKYQPMACSFLLISPFYLGFFFFKSQVYHLIFYH